MVVPKVYRNKKQPSQQQASETKESPQHGGRPGFPHLILAIPSISGHNYGYL